MSGSMRCDRTVQTLTRLSGKTSVTFIDVGKARFVVAPVEGVPDI